MTREQMIHILLNEQRDDISADIERSNIADQLKADGEMIERLEASLHNYKGQCAKFVAEAEKRDQVPKAGLHIAGHLIVAAPEALAAVGAESERLTAELDAALARVAELQAALEPFATGGPLLFFSSEQLRRAREALKGSAS